MKGLCKSQSFGVEANYELTGMKCLLTLYDCLFYGYSVSCLMNIHRILEHLRLRRAESFFIQFKLYFLFDYGIMFE